MTDELILQKWQTEYKKGFSKPLVLFALAETQKTYPYLLTKKIFELTQGEISIAGSNIYPMLARLEKDDLIVSHSDESNRKYYELSEHGKEFLTSLSGIMREFTDILQMILEVYRGNVRD
ncbi:MAG: PadR family transcriptional regulator [Promethearchaeota archaeon]